MYLKFLILEVVWVVAARASVQSKEKVVVRVNKCCARDEIFVDNACRHINETSTTAWSPMFTSEDGRDNIPVNFTLVIGEPDCGSTQPWPVFDYPESPDRLRLLPDGILRHYALRPQPAGQPQLPLEQARHHDYGPGLYCLDKSSDPHTGLSLFAFVCMPETAADLRRADFLMRRVLDPLFHAIAIACFLTVAVIYFVMHTLRDLIGNIVTTVCLCMIVSQAADMVRIFTEFSSHVSFMCADIICYTSLLAAFFWLNSLGYYIWKTFKSRNVFLRITDGRKYCYYSSYAWSCTLVMGIIAVAAHFALEIPKSKTASSLLHNQQVIGSLGMAIFFTPVAFTILVNIFFYATTLQIINRMNTYGRIHDKLKHSFRMFLLMFLVMTVAWLFMLLSWLNFEALVYCHIVINALQAPLILYICVFNQRRVLRVLSKTCCYTNCVCPCCRPPTEPELDWGDEMTAMNTY